jgi:hypothetical protein
MARVEGSGIGHPSPPSPINFRPINKLSDPIRGKYTLYEYINRLLLFIFLPFGFPWSFDLQRGHVFYLPLT